MSDRVWQRDVWSVLMGDGAEYLDVTIDQSDANGWPTVAAARGWHGDDYRAHQNQYTIWKALQRRGDLDPSFTLDRFLAEIAAAKREPPQTVNPTRPVT